MFYVVLNELNDNYNNSTTHTNSILYNLFIDSLKKESPHLIFIVTHAYTHTYTNTEQKGNTYLKQGRNGEGNRRRRD